MLEASLPRKADRLDATLWRPHDAWRKWAIPYSVAHCGNRGDGMPFAGCWYVANAAGNPQRIGGPPCPPSVGGDLFFPASILAEAAPVSAERKPRWGYGIDARSGGKFSHGIAFRSIHSSMKGDEVKADGPSDKNRVHVGNHGFALAIVYRD